MPSVGTVTQTPLQLAIEDLRGWVMTSTRELAVVLPLHGTAVAEPRLIAVGDAVSVVVTPAVVLRAVLRSGATSYVLVHTHVQDAPPGAADGAVTRRLVSASAIVGVRMVGHYVLTPSATHDCLAA